MTIRQWKAGIKASKSKRFQTRSDAKYQVFEYIEVYYNRKRLRSKLRLYES